MGRDFIGYNLGIILDRMRKQAERWGAELFQEDVESIDLKNRPFTVQSSERKVMDYFLSKCMNKLWILDFLFKSLYVYVESSVHTVLVLFPKIFFFVT